MDIRLVWLALGAFAGSVESSLIIAVLPAISSETGVSLAATGWLVTLYALFYGFGTPLISTVLGRVDRRTVVASAEFVFGCMSLLLGLLPEFVMLLVARTVLSMGAGTFTSTAQSTAVALADATRRGRAVAIVVMGGSLGVAIGAPVAVWVSQVFGWRPAYLGLGVLALVAALTMWRMLPGDIVGDRRTLRERVSVVSVPGMKWALATSGVMYCASSIVLTYTAPVTTELMGLEASWLPAVFLAFGVGAVAGTGVGGWLTDRYGGRQTMLVMIGLLVVELAALPLIAQLPESLVLPVYLADTVAFGICCWGVSPPQISRLAVLAPVSVQLSAALNLTSMNLGVAAAALGGGWVLQQYGVVSLCWVAALVAVAAVGVAWMVPDGRRVRAA
jgi:predicted MFS family arabinose efflux permease